MYTGEGRYTLGGMFTPPYFGADKIILSTDEANEADRIRSRLPGNMYRPGYNTTLGDPEPFFNFGRSTRESEFSDVKYFIENTHDDAELEHGDRVRAHQRSIGDADWWKKGYPEHHH